MFENRSQRDLHKAAILILASLLLYNYYQNSTKKVMVKTPQFSLLEPSKQSCPPVQDVYDQLIDIKNFSFNLNPQPCQNYTAGLLLLIIVSSNPLNFDNRLIIRETWGKSIDSTKTVFLLGQTENTTLMQLVNNESLMYGDIVQGTFADAYRNMTYKHVMGLKWVAHHCPTAKYVLKTDDDIVVNINGLRKFLTRELSPWGAKDLILCHRSVHAPVLRTESKWNVSMTEYANEFYPDYCSGYAIVYSQDVIPRLLKASQNFTYFWIDDVHVTGTLAQSVAISLTPANSLSLNMKRAMVLMYLGPEYSGPFLFGPWDLSVERIMQIWSALCEEDRLLVEENRLKIWQK